MAQANQQRNCPINLRAFELQRQLIDKAASIKKVSRSEFILTSACQKAENILLDQRLFLVNDETYHSFMDLLSTPPRENLALKTLLKSESPWEK